MPGSHCVPPRTRHYAERPAQRLRVLKVTAGLAAVIRVGFPTLEVRVDPGYRWIGVVNAALGDGQIPQPALRRPGPTSRPARAGKGEDQRRLLHGG